MWAQLIKEAMHIELNFAIFSEYLKKSSNLAVKKLFSLKLYDLSNALWKSFIIRNLEKKIMDPQR